jgi:outer membrane protein assembly factor BamA
VPEGVSAATHNVEIMHNSPTHILRRKNFKVTLVFSSSCYDWKTSPFSLTGGVDRFNASAQGFVLPRPKTRLGLPIAFLLLQLTLPAGAREGNETSHPAQIRAINVEVKNIFDPDIPGEDRWPYTWANALHIRTRAAVIRRQLLMRPGDNVSRSLMEESERNLRALPFIKEAKIVEVPVNKTESDLLVKTQDTWTTQPQIDFGSQGGESHFSSGIEEDNLFGYGKTASYFYRRDKDGPTEEIGYIDPQIGNSRLTLNSLFQATPFGNQEHLNVQRPFYSLETRYAGGANIDHVRTLNKITDNGTQLTQYGSNSSTLDAYGGIKLNDSVTDIHRLTLHYNYTENIYLQDAGTTSGSIPNNKALSGPIGSWTFDQNKFIKETFVDKAERIEDINLGHDSRVDLGYSSRSLGATSNSVPFVLLDSFGFGGDGPWFGLASYGMNGRYNTYASNQTGGRTANTLYFANLNFYDHLLPEFPLTGVVHVESAYVQNPDVPRALELGGDTGLRGFKVATFTGNKSVLANLEARFYYPYEVFHLAYLGGAAFIDTGQVQQQGVGFLRQDFHTDVGVGLRIGLTRSTVGSVYRIDVAYAIGPITQSNRIIVSISSGQGFDRNGNTFKNIASFLSSQ